MFNILFYTENKVDSSGSHTFEQITTPQKNE